MKRPDNACDLFSDNYENIIKKQAGKQKRQMTTECCPQQIRFPFFEDQSDGRQTEMSLLHWEVSDGLHTEQFQ